MSNVCKFQGRKATDLIKAVRFNESDLIYVSNSAELRFNT